MEQVVKSLAVDPARVRWACRRGMLELDVLFEAFMSKGYEQLSESDKQLFFKLLHCEDPELFAWFMGHETCPYSEFLPMIERVLQGRKGV